MALPKFTAGQSLTSPSGSYEGQAAAQAGGGMEMMLSIGCLLGCGAKALACITCGTSIPCWLSCAGPTVVDCATKCF